MFIAQFNETNIINPLEQLHVVTTVSFWKVLVSLFILSSFELFDGNVLTMIINVYKEQELFCGNPCLNKLSRIQLTTVVRIVRII